MLSLDISPKLAAAIEAVTNKRARFVLDHIVKHGFITADDIQTQALKKKTQKTSVQAIRLAKRRLLDWQRRGK